MRSTPNTVIILAPEDDAHALVVQKHLLERYTARCIIVSTAAYPASVDLSDWIGCQDDAEIFFPKLCTTIRRSEIAGVWRRRIKNHDLSEELTDEYDREVSRRDTRSALDGFFFRLSRRGTTVINDPCMETAGLNKAFQLECAWAVGLAIPRTLISNNADSVRRFVRKLQERGGSAIFKAFNCPKNFFVATQGFGEDDFDRLDALKFAPAIFQEYVAGRNLRVTVVGNELFPAEVIVSSERAENDWRLQPGNKVISASLDPKTDNAIRRLMSTLGLTYGAIDLKLTRGGETVFLEVNPWGQYLFVEIQTGQPISGAIAAHLIGVVRQEPNDHGQSPLLAQSGT
jgi:glutathione synthase/RimK-type ligase-like ATP-grasp enzyme